MRGRGHARGLGSDSINIDKSALEIVDDKAVIFPDRQLRDPLTHDAARGVQRIGFFKGVLGHVPVDVFMSGHPHFFEMQRRRRRVTDVDGTHLYFISPEDVCITKLLFGRDKDIADLERLFAAQRSLDLT